MEESWPKQLSPSSRRALSGFSQAVDGLRSLRRRPPSRIDRNENVDYQPSATSKSTRWLQHCAIGTFWPRRRMRINQQTSREQSMETIDVISPLPGSCLKPPQIPHDLTSGAAARAAAATQNEILESVRNQRSVEPKIPRDSESGIGIELRDRWEESKDKVVRKGQRSMVFPLGMLLIRCIRLCLYSTRRADSPYPILSRRDLIDQRGTGFPQMASVSKFTSCLETYPVQ